MDWSLVIRRNRDALLAVAAAIAALLGGREGSTVSRGLRRAALALLRPAEAAARRLIVIAARGLSVAAPQPSVFKPIPAGAAGAARKPAFRLFDRAKRFPRMVKAAPAGVPRIRTFWGPPSRSPASPPPAPRRADSAGEVDGARLLQRLAALQAALSDLPRQARRLARLRAGWAARRSAGGVFRPPSPLRIGRPPGWRPRPQHEVDLVLRECHALALEALSSDTS